MIGRIGKYTVEKELGQGGFGKVYLAFDPDVGQPVAIKKLRVEGNADLLRRFQLEIRTTARLRHKNIVTIHASGEEDGEPYLVMEFLEGQTLKQVIQDRLPLSLLDKVRIMTQVAEGLAYAHSKGVVHRDVKPENIMLLPDDNVKIMDFGIALGPNRDTVVTQTGGIIGTPSYFAPEQIEGSKANEQTDIFSFGDVFYELLSGIHPFEQYKNDWKALQLAIINYEPRPIGELLSGCPETLENLVHRTLAKEPTFRYQKFEEVQLDSEAILVDLKHEGAAAILREISGLMGLGDLQTALSKIQQAYKLEPGNREIRRRREEINLLIQKEQVKTRVAGLLAEAEKQMRERRFAEALQNLDACARLDSTNIEVGARLEEARKRNDAFMRANRLVSEARFHQQKGLLTEAHQRLEEALALDPEHTDAQRLSQRVHDELERRRVEQQVQQAIRTARDHMAAKRFREALTILDEIETVQPGAGGVPELRADIQQEQAEEERRLRAEEFNLALARTREAMQERDLERAGQMVESLGAKFGDEPGAADVLSGLRARLTALIRAKEIAQSQQRVRGLLKEKSFREALDLLAEALRKFPDDAGLERLRKSAEDLYRSHQRAEAIAGVVHQATSKRDRGDLQGALDTILEGRKSLGDEAAFADLGHQLEMEIEQQRYSAALERLLKDSSDLMAAGRYSEALDRLESASEFGGEAEVRALLDSARAAAAIHEERSYVEETLAAVEKLQSEKAWSQALGTVEHGLTRYPHNSRLVQSADRLRDLVELERARAAIEKHRVVIRREIDGRRWQQAAEVLRKARAEFPGDRAFDDLADQVDAGLYEHGWHAVEARVNHALNANSFSEALGTLENEATRTIYANDPRWKALARDVTKRREYEEALLEAERRRMAGSLSEAEELLLEIINQGPRDKRAQQLRGAIQSQQLEALRQEEIARITQGIREHLTRNDLTQAESELSAARTRYPGESIWSELQADLDGRQQALRRQAEMAAAEDGVRQSLSRDEIPQAVALWAAARARFPDHTGWEPLEAEIRVRQEALKRRADIAATENSVRRSLSGGNIRQASAALAAAREKFPGETIWETLEAEIKALQAAQQRQHEIAAIFESVRRRLKREHTQAELEAMPSADKPKALLVQRGEDLQRAGTELVAARAKYPDEHSWEPLQAEIEARRAVLDAENAIVEQVSQCLDRGEAAQAEARLATARAQYPDKEFWDLFLAEIKGRLELLKLREEVARVENSVRDRLKRNDPKGAEKELAAGQAKYPNEIVWTALQTEINARHAALLLEAERRDVAAIVRWSLDEGVRRAFQAELEAPVPYPIVQLWDVLGKAAARLDEARTKYPGESLWEILQAAIDQRRSQLATEIRESVGDCGSLDSLDWYARAAATARDRYPGDDFLETLYSEIGTRRESLERASEAEFEGRVRDLLKQGDLAAAQVRLSAARNKHPRAGVWAELQEEIDARQAFLTRQAGIAAAGERVRACLERDDLRQAAAELNAARGKYPNEALWTTLQADLDARLVEIEKTRGRAEVLLEEGRPADALALIEGRFAQEPRFTDLVTRARQALDLQRRREARDRDRDRLLAIQRQIETEPPKRKRKELDREAQGIAARYTGDQEIAELAAGVHSRVEPVGEQSVTQRPIPWKLISSAAASVAVAGVVLVWVYKKPVTPSPPRPTGPPPIAMIRVDIHTDPPGATLSVAGHSCVTPNCRLEIPPGSYQAEARLQGYEVKQQTVAFDSLNRTAVLTLQPLPPPPPPTQATLTLVVQTNLPDVLVYVDEAPRRRTDQTRSVTLALDARDHTVRVERNGYETPAAQQVKITAGTRQKVVFKLTAQNARLELTGAPADLEVRVDDKPLGRTDGSLAYLFPALVQSGNHTLSVGRGFLQGRRGAPGRTVSETFDPGQTVRVSWNPEPASTMTTPGPVPPGGGGRISLTSEDEERDWVAVRNTSDPAQLRNFRKNHPKAHADEVESLLEGLAWSDAQKNGLESLRAYLRDFRGGAHATEAESQIADLAWKGVDQTRIEQLRRFLEEYPKSRHALEAQRTIDLLKAQDAKADLLRKQVLDALNTLGQAFERKQEAEVKKIWPRIPKLYLESLKQAGQRISLKPQEAPKLQGDTAATVRCTLHVQLNIKDRDQVATVFLQYGGGRWIIDHLTVIQ
jgi:serine/threonine-protein kinase